MRTAALSLSCLALVAGTALAQVKAEAPGVVTMAPPTPAWFVLKSDYGAYVFDGDSGEMQGMISNEPGYLSPAIVTVPARGEAYLVESFSTRVVRGERNDVLTVIDTRDFTTKAEIDLPDRAAALNFRNHIGIMGDDRFVAVFNQTPAQSVGIVDVVERKFVGEIETPGCAVIMPSGERSFLMLCGDGRLQLIELGPDGKESRRSQSKPFFSVDKDAVFDQPMKTETGWVLVSREGLVYEVAVKGSSIDVSAPWPMDNAQMNPPNELGEKWRIGGAQAFAIHRASGLLYTLMHRGKTDTHGADGTEVWVIDLARHTRAGRIVLPAPASNILCSQEAEPKLYVYDTEKNVHVYDGQRLRKLRSLEKPIGPDVPLLQTLSQYD